MIGQPSQDQTANDGEENQDDENENAKEEENEETCLKTHHETQDVQGVADLQDTAATAQVDLKDEVSRDDRRMLRRCERYDDHDRKPCLFSAKTKRKSRTQPRRREFCPAGRLCQQDHGRQLGHQQEEHGEFNDAQ